MKQEYRDKIIKLANKIKNSSSMVFNEDNIKEALEKLNTLREEAEIEEKFLLAEELQSIIDLIIKE